MQNLNRNCEVYPIVICSLMFWYRYFRGYHLSEAYFESRNANSSVIGPAHTAHVYTRVRTHKYVRTRT